MANNAPHEKCGSLFLPTSQKELKIRNWDYVDVIIFTGDAYIDHPAFGAAVIGRTLEKEGYRVAIVPQPNWRDDLRDFKKLGKPRLFFGVTSGCMDSMVNHYTANKRLRSNDAYTPDGKAGFRPNYATTTYAKILKQLFPDTPVILGGIEASLRRLTHYDYWNDSLRPSILAESGADLLVYGMGERPIVEIAKRICEGGNLYDIPQTAFYTANTNNSTNRAVALHSYEECCRNSEKFAVNFCTIESESNKVQAFTLMEPVGDGNIVVNPPYPTMSEHEIDNSFDLPYTRLPHPRYSDKHIPAYEAIKFSVNIHRGCFGGCSFCTISAHQGKFIASRSEQSIVKEATHITKMAGFKGYLSDLGGPSANMYTMKGKNSSLCVKCKRNSCIYPTVCNNLNTDHARLLDLYRSVQNISGIKKVFIGSGIRYDLFLGKNGFLNSTSEKYFTTLLRNHVSGRLKVAPEHTEAHVLNLMRKPSFDLFEKLKALFDQQNSHEKLRQQLIPYFISSHPGCSEHDMSLLAKKLKHLRLNPEQVQDFTPTPMTYASVMFYTGMDPYKKEKVFIARSKEAKLRQKNYFFA